MQGGLQMGESGRVTIEVGTCQGGIGVAQREVGEKARAKSCARVGRGRSGGERGAH